MKTETQKLHNFQTMSCSDAQKENETLQEDENQKQLSRGRLESAGFYGVQFGHSFSHDRTVRDVPAYDGSFRENENQKQLSRGRLESAGLYGVQFGPSYSYDGTVRDVPAYDGPWRKVWSRL